MSTGLLRRVNNIAENEDICAASHPSIALVIPTKNRPKDLQVVVAGVLAQSVLPRQLIVVDQSETDESEQLINCYREEYELASRQSGGLVYVRDNTIRGLTAARNRALRLVECEIVIFLDDDVILDREFVRYIADTYAQCPSATGVSGIITNYSPPTWIYGTWTSQFARGAFRDDRQPVYWNVQSIAQDRPVRVTRLGGGLMSFRMAAIAHVQFDENLCGACEGEDVDFCLHLGPDVLLLIQPKAQLIHKQTPTARTNKGWLYLHVRTNWYLYRRGYARGPYGFACFVWLNVGHLIATALVSIRRFSLRPWSLWMQAVNDSRSLVRKIESLVVAGDQALSDLKNPS